MRRIARWGTVAAALIILALLGIVLVRTGRRSGPALTPHEYYARIIPGKKRLGVREGERKPLQVTIENRGQAAWRSAGSHPVFLSYHLQDESGKTLRFDNTRFPLSERVNPGQRIEMSILLRCPLEAGIYILDLDLLREGVAWFADNGSPTASVVLEVEAWESLEIAAEIDLEYGPYSQIKSSLAEIETIFKLIRLTLAQNEAAFSGLHQQIHGFSPGRNYPQIWLRDANTIIPASQLFYDEGFLNSWLENHLILQEEDGSLKDWFDDKGKTDTNSTETDQEASAVQAAYQVFTLIGRTWLQKELKGKRLIDRLEAALKYVFDQRFDPAHGLITGAHTADWGDVDIVDADQNAVYVDEHTHWTVDIYDQSMIYQACLSLAEMQESLEDMEDGKVWRKRAASLQRNTIRWLWQEDKGFFRVHRHLDDLTHPFDESDIFAMGGNVAAVLSGLADSIQVRRILETAVARQEQLGISTISGTLLPPYPAQIFAHPLMDELYEYQNGGQWDWFGGRLVYALFQHGYSRTALGKLKEIIEKNIANLGFFEWDDRSGTGRGSDLFCGAAGSMSLAVISGYFGIVLGNGQLILQPRLGQDSARVHIYYPAGDIFVAYDYRYVQESQSVRLDVNTNFQGRQEVRILSPWRDISSRQKLAASLRVICDGEDVPFRVDKINEDLYIIPIPENRGKAEIILIRDR